MEGAFDSSVLQLVLNLDLNATLQGEQKHPG
jgi:hypothetical protein